RLSAESHDAGAASILVAGWCGAWKCSTMWVFHRPAAFPHRISGVTCLRDSDASAIPIRLIHAESVIKSPVENSGLDAAPGQRWIRYGSDASATMLLAIACRVARSLTMSQKVTSTATNSQKWKARGTERAACTGSSESESSDPEA